MNEKRTNINGGVIRYARDNEDFAIWFDRPFYGTARIDSDRISTAKEGFIRIRRDDGKKSTLTAHIIIHKDEVLCHFGYIDGRYRKDGDKYKPVEQENISYDTLKNVLEQYNISDRNLERLDKYVEEMKNQIEIRSREGYNDIKNLKAIMRRLKYSEEYIDDVIRGIPVKPAEPHGRLVDIDKFLHDSGLDKAKKYNSEDRSYSYSTMMMYEIADMIDEMPVAMEATD